MGGAKIWYNLGVDNKQPDADKPTEDLLGGDYALKRKLGSGGMGVVWEAVQQSLNRKVAVKVLTPPQRKKEAWRERFTREARIVAQLHHPNIVKVYGAGTSGDICYYAMELVDGTRMDKFAFTPRISYYSVCLNNSSSSHRAGFALI